MKISTSFFNILALLLYTAMIVVNYLANALPINGINTGEASDRYPNLFTPAGAAFSIWGLIYLFLGIYSVYQLDLFKNKINPEIKTVIHRLNILFVITSIANISWIFAWHYNQIFLSVILMLILLITLIIVADLTNKVDLPKKEWLAVKLPFSIYFGWITIATIANITVLLVSLNWDGFGITPEIWTIIILLVGALISNLRFWKDKNIPYILVPIWAYFFIWLKHVSANGYNSLYPGIIYTTIFCILTFFVSIYFLIKRN